MPETNDADVITAILNAAKRYGIRVTLIGAAARQLTFDEKYGFEPYRITRDYDLATRVPDWTAFEAFIGTLEAEFDFQRRGPHKLRHASGTEIDLIPYGGVGDSDGRLRWPRTDTVMSLAGYESAEKNSSDYDIAGTRLPVAGLPNQVALKLYAFRDRRQTTRKDLTDLDFILAGASDALMERVFDELAESLAAGTLTFETAGPFLLGRDVTNVVTRQEREDLLGILDHIILTPPDYPALTQTFSEATVNRVLERFEAFRDGVKAADEGGRSFSS